MQIVIIAGGEGKRMQPLVTHKALFPFFGVSMIEHTLKSTMPFSPTKTIIVVHPSILEAVTTISKKYQASIVVQKEPLGMADAVLTAQSALDASDAVLLLDVSKVQEQSGFATFNEAIKARSDSIILAGKKVTTYKHGGYFAFDTNGQITHIVEKPGEGAMPSPYLKLVFDYFPNAQTLMQKLETPQSDEDDVYEIGVSQLVKENGATMVDISGDYASLKHAPRVLDVMEVFLSHYVTPGIDATATIASNATIVGKVQIGKNVRVFENAVIKGPAYIGDNTVIGNGTLIRESCIEADCEIGYNTEVARSYVGPHTKCHTSYVGDSILEGQINLAAGTITANLRFDNRTVMVNLPSGRIDSGRRKFGAILARGTKTGIHASLMPGTVTEQDSIIGTEVQYAHAKK